MDVSDHEDFSDLENLAKKAQARILLEGIRSLLNPQSAQTDMCEQI